MPDTKKSQPQRLADHSVQPIKSKPIEASIVVALVVALCLHIIWLSSDREPLQKEMTFAYRKHIVSVASDRNPKHLIDLRQRLHEIDLMKQGCSKLAEKRYRCT